MTDRATNDRDRRNGDQTLPALGNLSRVRTFLHYDFMGPGLLLASAVTAMVVVNFGGEKWYHDLWETKVGFAFQSGSGAWTLHYWVNEGLMAIFFFVVGLEIKRELLAGELASWRRALLPVGAAVGGMAVPALIFAFFNWGGPGARGWGVPMATDIAFATGCLALLKRWVPASLAVFLVALAIVDDLGAVAVIALFYTDTIELQPLVTGGSLIVLSFGLAWLGVRAASPYVVIGVAVWLAFLDSGIHATVAGVLLAFSIPHTARYETVRFSERMRTLLHRFDDAERDWENEEPKDIHQIIVNGRQQTLLRNMLEEVHHVEAPLQRLEHDLEPLVLFVILPIFAFANAGVQIEPTAFANMLREPVTYGVFLGLVLGKPIGIWLSSWIMVRIGMSALPRGVTWSQVFGVGVLAGIGFTMSLFVNDLAFTGSDDGPATQGKIGIFLASIVSASVGLVVLRIAGRHVLKSK